MSEIQTPDEGTETTDEITPKDDQQTETVETSIEVQSATETEPQSQPETPSQPDYKEKFTESAREGILLNERVNVANTRIEQLTKQDTPTDEAMRALYPEWDNLDDYNKKVLIRQETIAMQQAAINAKQQDIDARQQLEDQLDEVIEGTEYGPKLKGKESQFKAFARQKKNRGIDAGTLARAFLFDASDDDSMPTTPQPRPAGLPAGSGGPRDPLKPKKMSIEEAAKLRTTDNKRYMELVKSGQIDDDI